MTGEDWKAKAEAAWENPGWREAARDYRGDHRPEPPWPDSPADYGVGEQAQNKQRETERRNSKLALTFFGQLTKPTSKPWLIKNGIARGETSSWIAPPGQGKSALLTDIGIHLGGGKFWRGYRTKERCGVLYLALERADLVKRRLIAHRLRDNLPDDLPIAVSGQVIDLMHRGCVKVILGAIHEAEQHFGLGVGLVIIDTYPKGIAAKGGDESQAKDQNIVLANLRRVLDQKHIHIAGVGHTGKDETRGERGSNAQLADVDLMIQIAGEEIRTVMVKKANDQPEGPLTSFRLETVRLRPRRGWGAVPYGYSRRRDHQRRRATPPALTRSATAGTGGADRGNPVPRSRRPAGVPAAARDQGDHRRPMEDRAASPERPRPGRQEPPCTLQRVAGCPDRKKADRGTRLPRLVSIEVRVNA